MAQNGYQMYLKSRPAASSDSNRRIKELPLATCSVHPVFAEIGEEVELERENLLEQMKSYRPHGVSLFTNKPQTSNFGVTGAKS